MAIEEWTPTKTITRQEQYVLERCKKKRKLFASLREHRSELFDKAFQREFAEMYRDTGAGKDPVCRAVLAMALIMQRD